MYTDRHLKIEVEIEGLSLPIPFRFHEISESYSALQIVRVRFSGSHWTLNIYMQRPQLWI